MAERVEEPVLTLDHRLEAIDEAIDHLSEVCNLVGVNRARTILGINNDPESPLAAAADAAITADWRVALPRVVDAVLASVTE